MTTCSQCGDDVAYCGGPDGELHTRTPEQAAALQIARLAAEAATPGLRWARAIAEMQAEVAEINEEHGWYDEERTVGEDIALLHSEVSEMLEAYRDHGLADATGPTTEIFAWNNLEPARVDVPKPEGFGAEAADVLIRLLDTCERRGVDLVDELVRKVAYNRTRPYRHGGKKL